MTLQCNKLINGFDLKGYRKVIIHTHIFGWVHFWKYRLAVFNLPCLDKPPKYYQCTKGFNKLSVHLYVCKDTFSFLYCSYSNICSQWLDAKN